MLTSALPTARQLVLRPVGAGARAQWLVGPHLRTPFYRKYANTKPSINDPEASVLPGTRSTTAVNPQPAPPGPVGDASPKVPTPPTPTTDKIVPPQNMPLVPPSPPTPPPRSSPIPPSTASPVPPPPPPPPPALKKRSGRFRRFVLYLILLGGLSYAGGVYYSLLSDNFHDFFTEYVPFGEEAVLYFEEREYRKRFPSLTNPSNRPSVDSGNRITIPSKSGVSWKVAGKEHQGSDTTTKGAHMTATDASKPKVESALQNAVAASGSEKKETVEKTKKKPKTSSSSLKKSELQENSGAPAQLASSVKPKVEEKPTPKASPKVKAEAVKIEQDPSLRPPEVDEPSRIMPVEPIDPLKIKNATEPLVQDLVKILNDIITVVNSDNAAQKYSSTINKAKSALQSVGARILDLKATEERAANDKIQATQLEFDTAAKELVRRLEEELHAQESHWKADFETERAALAETYETRLKHATESTSHLSHQKLQNELLQQSLRLKTKFLSDLTTLVDTERNGRLANLSTLSASVSELESLTAAWASILADNQRTQHLSIALSALRATLDDADRPVPFTHYLAALKELSASDPVISAAIAAINPSAYQRGIPTQAQLLDRFRRVAAEVRKAALLPANAGVASHAASYLLSGVMFQKKGMPAPASAAGKESGEVKKDDVEAVLARAGTLLEEGRLDEAAREMNALEGWAGVLSWDWLAEVRRVLEVRMAVEVMGAEVRLEGLKVGG